MADKNPSRPKEHRSDFWASIKLLLLIVLIALVPVVMEQVSFDPENVKLVGRGVAGVGAVVVLYGLVKQIGKIVAVLALALLALMVLISEGIIDVPKVLPWNV